MQASGTSSGTAMVLLYNPGLAFFADLNYTF
jgi:hypothetical protein